MAIDYKAKYLASKAQVADLTEQLEAARARSAGMRSDGTIDKYTDMDAAELRALVIKREGDVDAIVKGLHSRQRSIKMREWLRENGPKAKAATATNKAPRKAKPAPEPEAPARKRKPKVEAAPAKPVKKPGRKL